MWGTLSLLSRVVPTVLPSLDGKVQRSEPILDAVRLFQTVSGIGCVHVTYILRSDKRAFVTLLGLPVAHRLEEAVHGLSPILRIGPNSRFIASKCTNGSQVPDAVN